MLEKNKIKAKIRNPLSLPLTRGRSEEEAWGWEWSPEEGGGWLRPRP